MAAADPIAKYRSQNGIADMGSVNPRLVTWIRQAATETGADPAALLATSLMENGGRLYGKPGDHGTSFGPFQFHIGGALGSHTPAWASTYAAVLNRAQEFARYKVHGGPGAAAVQRPADRTTYAAGVNSLLARASSILGQSPSAPPAAPQGPTQPGLVGQIPRPALSWNPGATMDFINGFLGDASIERLTELGQRLAEAQAGPPTAVVTGPPTAPARGPSGKVITGPLPKLIGFPYQGTHTRGNWESDNAVDIPLPAGTPVYAVADGTIGAQIGSQHSSDPHLAGLRVHLSIPGNELFYQHLSRLSVRAGQHVKAGQIIGYTGALNHLHLGVRSGDPRRYA